MQLHARTCMLHVAAGGALERLSACKDGEHVVRPHVQVHQVLRQSLQDTTMQMPSR